MIQIKDDQPVKESVSTADEGSTLKVEHVKASQAGTYKCKFSNRKGKAEEVFSVQVNVTSSVGSGIIAAIVIVILIVFVLLGILIRKIRQDKVKRIN